MRKTARKWFWAWDFDKEEKWLNEMVSKGFVLVEVGFCKYIFEECTPGEYTIRIELLDNMPTHIESQKYIKFVEDTGAENLGSVMRWVFFRRKTELGSFDLYSDIESRIKHLNRILALIGIIACVNIPNGINITAIGVSNSSLLHLIFGLIILCLVALLGCGFIKILRKKRKLQKDKNLFE